jgi:hypothetical protein
LSGGGELVKSNAERQADYRRRQKEAREKYDAGLVQKQIEALAAGLNEVRGKVGLPQIQLPKSGYRGEVD